MHKTDPLEAFIRAEFQSLTFIPDIATVLASGNISDIGTITSLNLTIL